MIKFLGAEHAKEIEIVSNDVILDGNKWDIQWHDESVYGNDKSKGEKQKRLHLCTHPPISQVLEKARQQAPEDTIFVFCGDGISDISAAKHADLLFARKGRDLETHCDRNGIPYVAFDSFQDILVVVDRLASGKTRLEKDDGNGFCRLVNVV